MRALLTLLTLSVCFSAACGAPRPTNPPVAAVPTTTLDPRAQRIAREELDRMVVDHKPSSGVIVVLEPSTGAILAAEGWDGAHADATLATARTFVTGSTLKSITIAAALDDKTIAADAKVDCATRSYGALELHDASPHGTLSLAEVLAVSSNVGASRVYDTLGLPKLYGWFRRFHFDDAPSHLPVVTDGAGIQAAFLAGGELAETTPMQMAAAYGVIFGAGRYVAPTLTRVPAKPEQVLREETAKTVVSMLEGVVTSAIGTGKLARIDGRRVAGKTGTADHHGNNYGSFVGTVLDAKTPFVVLVGLEVPKATGYTGGSAAAPVFARVARRLLET